MYRRTQNFDVVGHDTTRQVRKTTFLAKTGLWDFDVLGIDALYVIDFKYMICDQVVGCLFHTQ